MFGLHLNLQNKMEHQSKEVVDKLSRDLKAQPAMELPREIGKMIVPVFNVNPERLIKVKSAGASDSTGSGIHTTDSIRETYLVGAQISVSKDAVADSLSSSIKAFVKGNLNTATSIIQLQYEPTTAENLHEVVQFNYPILLEKGKAITITNSTATASIDAVGIIYFYEVDPQ